MTRQFQPNAPHSLQDRLLFAQYLEFAVDLSPEDCFDRLMGLQQPRRGTFNPFSITTRNLRTKNHLYETRVAVTRYGRGMSYNAAKFTSVIDVNNAGQTTITGEIRAGAMMLFFIVGLIPLFLISIGDARAWAFPWIVAALGMFYVWEIRSDYLRLRALIYEALQQS